MLKKILAALTFSSVVLASSASMAATEIQWWHAMTGKLGEEVDKIANGFNATQSEFKVVAVNKGNYTDTMTAAIAAFRAHKQPHIVQVFEVGTATMMAAKGAIYPLTELMKDTGQPFDIDAYLPAVVSYYSTPSGDLLSLPFNSSTPVLWYNKDAFRKAGLDPNQPPRTWDAIESYGKALQAAGYPCGFSFGWQSWVMIENFSAWHNLPIGTKENGFAGLDTRLTFNNDKVVSMIQKIADWQKTKLFDYGGRRGDSLPKFLNQECGMWMNSSAYYGSIANNAKFDFGEAMSPYLPAAADKPLIETRTELRAQIADIGHKLTEKVMSYEDYAAQVGRAMGLRQAIDAMAKRQSIPQNSIIGGATLWVLRGHPANDYKGVAKFFTYMSSPEIQAEWHQVTGYVPITTAAYELSKKQGFYKTHPGTDTAIKELSLHQPTANSRGLRFGNFVQIRDIINDELEAIWAGKKSAKEGLDEAVKRGNELLRKFQEANE